MNARNALANPSRADAALTALIDEIRQTPLRAHFGRATLKAAEALAARHRAWHPPLAWFRPDGSDAQALQGAFDGADGTLLCPTVCIYTLFGQTMIDTTCSCAQSRCEHAAALLLRVQQLLDWPRAMTPLQRWQQSFERIPAVAVSAPSPTRAWSLRCRLAVDDRAESGVLTAQLFAVADDDDNRDATALPIDDARVRSRLSRQALLWQAQLAATQRRVAGTTRYELRGRVGAQWLDELLAAGACFDASGERVVRAGALRVPLWRWRHDCEGCARIAIAWPATTRLVELDGLRWFDEADAQLGRVDLAPEVWRTLARMPPVPPGEAAAFAAQWPPHALFASVPQPPAPPALRELAAPLHAIALLGASRHLEGGHAFHVRAFAQYAGHRLDLAEAPHRREVVRADGDGYVRIHRDIDAEWPAARALREAGFAAVGEVVPGARRVLAPAPDAHALAHRAHGVGGADAFVAVHAALQALGGAGVRIELDPDLPFQVLPQDTPLRATLDAGAQPGSTHFQLAVDADGEEIDILPIVLDGYARRAFALAPAAGEAPDAHWLAPLGAQRWLPVPLARLREWLAPLVECLGRGARAMRDLAPAQAMALHETLQAQGIDTRGATAYDIARMFAALREARKATQATALPTTFRGALRPYQHDGLRWLQSLRTAALGGVLADDMGLGKTVQVIAHLCVEQAAGRLERPALVVAPTSLVFNWLDELARFAPSLHCLDFTGASHASLYDDLQHADVVVTSYALLTPELARLERVDFALVVFDEAQWIKNPSTQTARATRRLRAAHRLAVTGTPLENHLGELWAYFDTVLPGYLGDARTFNRTFRVPIERHEDDARRAALRRRIAPFLLRREKAQVAPELPAKTEVVLRVAMGEAQRRLYESLRLAQSARVREALDGGNTESRILVLSALLRLRQACCDPRLLPGVHAAESAKLAALLDLVRTLRGEGRRIVVFSQFTSMLALIADALRESRLEHELLTGDTRDRAAPVQRFQRGDAPILLASLKAGGVGLNLTAADVVVHYDPWWNPAVERQAVDRAHRIGRDAPVLVYKLLCIDTIEERIEAMKQDKGDLAVALLDGGGTLAAPLDEADVRRLFELPARGER